MIHEQAIALLSQYGKAWTTQDANLITEIFTADATYFDPGEGEFHGHAGIKKYWEEKVIGSQKDIAFKLLNTWVDGDAVIAEWDASFIDTKRNLRIIMREVAIFTVKEGKFSSLREYYESKKQPL